MIDYNRVKSVFLKTGKSFGKSIPLMFTVIFLISLINTLVSKDFFSKFFVGNVFIDSFVGSFFGSFFAGNPITSYIIAGELLDQGISILAVTSFIVSWVTVGIVQLPVEMEYLGKRFSIFRNLVAFIFSFVVAILVFFGVGLV